MTENIGSGNNTFFFLIEIKLEALTVTSTLDVNKCEYL